MSAGAVAHRAAVLGHPIGHSLSPVLHRAAYAALGLDWTYHAFDCVAAELAGFLAEHTDWAGFSCTMPLKREALRLASWREPRAVAIGAANTLCATPDGWAAYSTDAAGIAGALDERGVPAAVPACLIGAGGTAQSALAALADRGTTHISVLVRDVARTVELRTTAEALGVSVSVAQLSPDSPQLGAPLVLCTLPAGAADPLAAHGWRRAQTVLDVVYRPWPTALARAAQAGGATVIGGALMLLHQAGEQVRLMTGCPAPLEAMRQALAAG